ncbi:hypothetical protein [Winogradskyella immobilis]|uniref:DUF1097 domain-containing protein n=1 Tax=Winogradskyella immobilis TaxID=2816852 RepID=A0ABS8EPT6_9FLAO|nr:hypothetical protein [Winogradskyella immobilis]MCC1485230.1 hypothetical protein [Winogradskyella immobilis]MCG0017322.1 hypothetical protein [Winogradskyella immobilis]
MNKSIINFIITIILAFVFSLFLPWWSVMLAGFLSALFVPLKHSSVFFIPFLAIVIFWGIYAFTLSSGNDFILAKRIAVLLPLGGNPYVLILVTGIIGGIAAGLAAIFGKQCQLLLKK